MTEWLHSLILLKGAPQLVLLVKKLPARRDTGLIPGYGKSPGGGHGTPLHCSCLENPMDRGAWRATVHRITRSQTWLKQTHTLLKTETEKHFDELKEALKIASNGGLSSPIEKQMVQLVYLFRHDYLFMSTYTCLLWLPLLSECSHI